MNSPTPPPFLPPLATAYSYQRRTPETSLLRRIVMAQWPKLERAIREANDGSGLPRFICKAEDGFIKCGMLGHGFLRLFCRSCRTDQLVAFSCKVRGLCSSCDGRRMTELAAHIVDSVIPDVPVRQLVLTLPPDLRTVVAWNAELRGKVLTAFMRALEKHYVQQALAKGAVEPKFAAISVLQRWAGALRIFPHWHVLVADGAWHKTATGLKFLRSLPMRTDQVEALLADTIKRVTLQAKRFYARRADADGTLKPGDPALATLLQGSLFGPQELQRAEPAAGKSGLAPFTTKSRNCVDSQGFNLHANTAVHELARDRLEHLVRYICRPAVAAKRIVASGPNHVLIQFKNPWRGGVTGVRLTSRDLTLRLLAQVPLPKVASVRYHGLFAPAARQRAEVVPALGGRVAHNKRKGKRKAGANVGAATGQDVANQAGAGAEFKLVGAAAAAYGEVEKEYSTKLTWAQCLRRAFFLDAMACPCGGRRQVISVILEASEVEKILRHVKLWREGGDKDDSDITEIRGPPGDLVPAEDQPDDDWDGWDEPPPLDWAA